jgi:3-hydroxyacyl-[acyl-carrier-protein] dehydratase
VTAATALRCRLDLLRSDADGAVSAFAVPADDPVFSGHYPGFPVLPGVMLVEAADRTVRAWAEPGAAHTLAAMSRCRFLRPVYPGERLTVEITVTRVPDGLRVKASAGTSAGKVAEIRLTYRTTDVEEGSR